MPMFEVEIVKIVRQRSRAFVVVEAADSDAAFYEARYLLRRRHPHVLSLDFEPTDDTGQEEDVEYEIGESDISEVKLEG